MVVETMWPDVAGKCTKLFYEKDEEKKAQMKEQAAQVRKHGFGRVHVSLQFCAGVYTIERLLVLFPPPLPLIFLPATLGVELQNL